MVLSQKNEQEYDNLVAMAKKSSSYGLFKEAMGDKIAPYAVLVQIHGHKGLKEFYKNSHKK